MSEELKESHLKKMNIIEAESKLRYPYSLFYKVLGGEPIQFKGRVDAVSEAQARFEFRRNYPKVRDLEAIAEVWVEIDNAELQRRMEAKKSAEEREAEAIKNAWWNRD